MPAKKKSSTKKGSLVDNINERKKAGKSRPKSSGSVSKESYSDMKKGWPKTAKKKRAGAAKKSRARKKTAKK